MAGLGFVAGLPNPLLGDTLNAWLYTHEVSLTAIGLLGFAQLPYNFKFLWAPVFDRWWPPFSTRRRAWAMSLQVALAGAFALLAVVAPSSQTMTVGAIALFIGFAASSQDVVLDAYRAEVLPRPQLASGTAVYVAGYRGGLLVAGAVALFCADWLGWRFVFLGLAAAMLLVGLGCSGFGPVPTNLPPPPRSWKEAFLEPVRELLRREGIVAVLFVVAFYRFGDVLVGKLRTPFLLSLDFSLTEVGAIGKGAGMVSTLVGALLGGVLVTAWGLRRSMLVFGIGQAGANLAYCALAYAGKNYALMATGIVADNFLGGMGSTALVTFFMVTTDKRYTAVQFALLTSLMSVPGRFLGLATGWLTEHIGWAWMWGISVLVAIPALALIPTLTIRDAKPAP